MVDTLRTLICPACGEIMEKVFIPSQGINIDICTEGCGGIYFDNREFANFDEQNEDVSEILAKLEGKEFKSVDTDKVRYCPSCGAKMVKNSTSVKNKIEVDDCYTCGGKFLDNEELQKIRDEYKNNAERTEDVLRYVYQQVGQELTDLDVKYANSQSNRTIVQKIFYKIMGF